jgi:hypothetical protein
MEVALLMFDVVVIMLVLLWAARGQGSAGLFAWRSDPAAKPESPQGQHTPKRR